MIVVNNMEHAKAFYKELLGLDVILDSDGNTVLTEGLVLQDASVWKKSVEKEAILPNQSGKRYRGRIKYRKILYSGCKRQYCRDDGDFRL